VISFLLDHSDALVAKHASPTHSDLVKREANYNLNNTILHLLRIVTLPNIISIASSSVNSAVRVGPSLVPRSPGPALSS
jgi:hypothetical protein